MQIRKHISALLTMLILVSSMGLALNVHYCHGKISSVNFAYRKAEPCNGHKDEKKAHACGVEKDSHKKCCKDDLVKLKDTKSDNILSKSLQLDLGAFCLAEEWNPNTLYSTTATIVTKDTPSFYCESNAPPLYRLYCQYIFYA